MVFSSTGMLRHLQKSPKTAACAGSTPPRPSCREAMSQPRVASIGASSGRPRLVASQRHSRGSTELPIACPDNAHISLLYCHIWALIWPFTISFYRPAPQPGHCKTAHGLPRQCTPPGHVLIHVRWPYYHYRVGKPCAGSRRTYKHGICSYIHGASNSPQPTLIAFGPLLSLQTYPNGTMPALCMEGKLAGLNQL
jgi:hypothetical protein